MSRCSSHHNREQGKSGMDRYVHDGRNMHYMSSCSVSTAASSQLRRLADKELGSSRASWDVVEPTNLTDCQPGYEEVDSKRGQQYIISVQDDDSEASSELPYTQSPMAHTHHSYRNDHSVASSRDKRQQDPSIGYAPVRHNQIRNKDAQVISSAEVLVTQRKSIFESLYEYVNPTIPGEADTPAKRSNQLVTMEALRSNEDALDKIFNTLENFSCRDDMNIARELQMNSVRQDAESPKRSGFQDRFLGSRFSSNKKAVSSNRVVPTRADGPQDVLDHVFEGVEHFACQQGMDENPSADEPRDRDTFDKVFESMERFTCNDEYTAAQIHQRGLNSMSRRKQDPPAYKAKGKYLLLDNDVLEQFGRGFESALCNSNVSTIGRKGDLLDRVFEGIEGDACNGRSTKTVNAGYDGKTPGLSSFMIDHKNSLLARAPTNESREWFQTDSEALDSALERKPSFGSTQPPHNLRSNSLESYQEQDVIDFVFEKVESGVCQHGNSRSDERAKLKKSLERIKALQDRFDALVPISRRRSYVQGTYE